MTAHLVVIAEALYDKPLIKKQKINISTPTTINCTVHYVGTIANYM